MRSLPPVPWQITGNHWVTLPCIHPADASIHAISVVHAQSRGAIEFTASTSFVDGDGEPLIRFTLSSGAGRRNLGTGGIAWSRDAGWMPAFSCREGDLAIRGVVCAPHGVNADIAGAVVEISVENRGKSPVDIAIGADGVFGKRLLRVRSARACLPCEARSRSAAPPRCDRRLPCPRCHPRSPNADVQHLRRGLEVRPECPRISALAAPTPSKGRPR